MKKFLPLVLLFFLSSSVTAQYLPPVYNQFFMNPYIYNPAYAGVEGHAVVFAMYKNQWGQIEGAPSLAHANFHIPLKGGMAFGAFGYNESIGPLTTSGGKITGGYLLTLDREHFFRFGLSIGAGSTMVDQSFIDDPNDAAYQNIAKTGSFLLGDFGFTYHFGHFNVGVALPSLFSNTFPREDGLAEISFKPTDNILFKTNYRGHINDDIAIEPHLIYRYSKYNRDQYEGTVILHIYHLVWVGGSYRRDDGFVGLLGAKVKEKMGIGYSYSLGNANYASQLGGTHEIHVGYHLGSKKEHAEHVSSFIKSHRLDAEQRAKQSELERQRKLQALRESREAAQQKSTEDDNLGSLLGGGTVVTEVEEKPKNDWNYEREETLIERVNEFGETEKGIKFDRVNEEGQTEVVFSWLPPPPPGATSETYEIANPEEPPLERIAADGSKEVGVKWIRTIDGGSKEVLVVWDPILTESEASKIDHNPSQALGLGAAKIVINSVPVVIPSVVQLPVEAIVEEPSPIEENPADQTPEVVQETPQIEEIPQIEEETPIPTTPATEVLDETPEVSDVAPEMIEEPKEVIEQGIPDKELTDDFRTHEELAESNDHLEVKRGGHMLELVSGNYVVAGAFNSFQHADDYSDELFQRGFHDTKVGYLSARGYYYVVIFRSENLKAANNQRNKVKSQRGLSKVWVLKVND
ncbi:MAG: PorP/SprF family type IX secretion system membrane protein [Cyclobacteriaceae bacterium]